MKKILCAVEIPSTLRAQARARGTDGDGRGADAARSQRAEGIGVCHYLWDDAELEFVLEHAKAAAEEAGVLDQKGKRVRS